jgi:hypothetical protein
MASGFEIVQALGGMGVIQSLAGFELKQDAPLHEKVRR